MQVRNVNIHRNIATGYTFPISYDISYDLRKKQAV